MDKKPIEPILLHLDKPSLNGDFYPIEVIQQNLGKMTTLRMIPDCDGDLVPVVGIRKYDDVEKERHDILVNSLRAGKMVEIIEKDLERGIDIMVIRDRFHGSNVINVLDDPDDYGPDPVVDDGDECCAMEDGRPGDRVYKPENQKDKNKRNWNHQKRNKFPY